MLFPHLAQLSIERVFLAGTAVRIRTVTRGPAAVYGTGRRRSMLEDYKSCLLQRWAAGCTDAAA